jgi:quercetin dioxygenase-like cupin family protein
MKFSIQHAKDKPFSHDGLREYFDYRDLGIYDSTDKKVVAHVIKASKGSNAHGDWHCHEVEFQFVFVLKGWAIFEYEGHGTHKLEAGTCVHQAPGIRHREIEHSDDFETLELILPGDFKTIQLP